MINKLLHISTIIFLCLVFVPKISGQNHTQVDSLSINTIAGDTIISDSTQILQDTVQIKAGKKNSSLEYPVEFSAEDSIVLYGNGKVFMYGNANMIYQDAQNKEITADFITIDMDSTIMTATFTTDSLGNEYGFPHFIDGGQEYDAREIRYNFKSERGYIRGAKTQEGEGYIIAEKTKKTADGYMNMKDGKYTTCDNHDHPHFYLKLTKGKVKPGGYVAAGPAYMVLEDVPLPLAIPFGFFPFTSKYSSGIIMPSIGDEMQRGFFLRSGGYYFALNDYVDLAVTGDIYTKGSWALNGQSTYKKRYKFDGRMNISYINTVDGYKNTPEYSVSKNFSINWTHRQDAKANPFSTFSASVDFKTSGYNKNDIYAQFNPQQQAQSESSSSISFQRRFAETPFSLSLNAGVRQRMTDSVISLTFPNITFDVNRIYPLKKKNRVGKEKFYEKFAFSYSMTFENYISTKENKLLNSSLSKDWQNGIKHSPKIDLPLNIAKYLTLTPSFTYTERWYFKKIEQSWNDDSKKVDLDTISGFYRVYDFNAALSLNTTIYGFYSPIKKLKDALGIGDIRHLFKPSLSFNYTPDFADKKWKMYDTYEKPFINPETQEVGTEEVLYSPFSGSRYGVPSAGKQASMSLALDNNLEMKVKDRAASDTTGNLVYKKVSLIDNFYLRASYNFAADSMNLSKIGAGIRIKITKSYTISLDTYFDPYMYALDSNGNPRRVNKFRWNNGKFPYFEGTSTSFEYTIGHNTFKKKDKKTKQQQQGQEDFDEFGMPVNNQASNDSINKMPIEKDLEGYQKPEVEWSVHFAYNISYRPTNEFDYDKMQYKRSFDNGNSGILTLDGYITPSHNWRLRYSMSVSTLKQIKITSLSFDMSRDLHCWTLSAMVTPFGYYKSFMVTIAVKASMLRDLKYEKRNRDNLNLRW